MIYKFPQFNVAIENPTITIDLNTISDKAIDQLLGVDVLLTTDSASFGVRAEDMPYIGTWEDSEVQEVVNEWIKQFEINEN
jgi:hypothetical protein